MLKGSFARVQGRNHPTVAQVNADVVVAVLEDKVSRLRVGRRLELLHHRERVGSQLDSVLCVDPGHEAGAVPRLECLAAPNVTSTQTTLSGLNNLLTTISLIHHRLCGERIVDVSHASEAGVSGDGADGAASGECLGGCVAVVYYVAHGESVDVPVSFSCPFLSDGAVELDDAGGVSCACVVFPADDVVVVAFFEVLCHASVDVIFIRYGHANLVIASSAVA